jgi:MOSC domain-containing protein YiiM
MIAQDPLTAKRLPSVLSVQVGRIAPLGPEGVPSAFVKRAITAPVRVHALHLQGDEQADLRVHGGLEKAVYAYAAAHYSSWLAEYPRHAERLVPGGFGENLSIEGLKESDLCAGDVHAIGSARLQVCQPRQPCFKFALRFEDLEMPRAMIRSGRAGWYYRVLEEGVLQAGDEVRLVERPNPRLPFTRLIDFVHRVPLRSEELEQLAHAAGVAAWIRESAHRRRARQPGS